VNGVVYLVDYVVYWPLAVANGLDTALHITVLLHGIYVGAISIWGGLARPNGRASKHDQMSIELNSLDLNVSRSRTDARRYWGVHPDELRAGRSIAPGDHIKIKGK
jgi:hypothetical protein